MPKPSRRAQGRFGRHLWGFASGLMPRLEGRIGTAGAIRWMARHMPEYDRAFAKLGPLRCHLACVVASLLNGCEYCGYGHARALQLYYFRERGKLFPLDEHQLIALSHVGNQELHLRLSQALTDAGMADDIALVQRLYALKFEGAAVRSTEDRKLQYLIQIFDMLNACGAEQRIPFDEEKDPISQDAALKERYDQARQQQRPARA
jgi:hypothetical protein